MVRRVTSGRVASIGKAAFPAAILAWLAVSVCVPSMSARAAEEGTEIELNLSSDQTGSQSDEDLFGEYVDSVFETGDTENGISIAASNARREENLSDMDRTVYEAVYEAACAIADGNRSSTIITIPLSLTGVSAEQAYANYSDGSSIIRILYSLLDDCPYELYWYDKTNGTRLRMSGGDLTLYLPVIDSYAVSRTTGTYEADTAVTGAARRAAANAQSIAANAYGEDLYSALDYYRGEICDLTEYNYSALSTGYGNPWEIIWVFDGDPTTNVVCEGYAKSFQYLCDLYAARHPELDFDCYVVEGALGFGTSEGHMWNIVRMDDGFNYLADITNCDGRSNPRRFFLVGANVIQTAQVGSETRTLSYVAQGRDGSSLTYRYVVPSASGGSYINMYPVLYLYSENEVSVSEVSYAPGNAGEETNPDGADERENSGESGNPGSTGRNENVSEETSGGDENGEKSANEGTADGTGSQFRDVADPDAYYYEPVYWAVAHGITVGTSADTFSPQATVTRAQFVTFLWRLAGRPSAEEAAFTDLPSGSEFRTAISWAYQNHITSGTGNDTFSPDAAVTREQAVTFLWRFEGKPYVSASEAYGFSDVTDGAWYSDAVRWGASSGIVMGNTDGTFGGKSLTTRGQAITFLWRAEGGEAS